MKDLLEFIQIMAMGVAMMLFCFLCIEVVSEDFDWEKIRAVGVSLYCIKGIFISVAVILLAWRLRKNIVKQKSLKTITFLNNFFKILKM